jgi:uroporphyrinogen-III synthase
MIAWLDLAARGEAEVVTSPMTLVEAYDGRTTEQRWDWVLSRCKVAVIGKEEARQARRLLADVKLHGHKYAIDAVLAVIARQQQGQVTVFTSDVDDIVELVPSTIVVKKV